MNKPAFTFDPAAHVYRLGDTVLPSVTQILKCVGLLEYRGSNEYAMALGSAVHRACELWDNGTLDEERLEDSIRPYLDAYKRFIAESGFEPVLIEQQIYHPDYLYAGTIDRVGILNNKHVLLDIKSGSPHPATELQLAGYHELLHVSVVDDPERAYILYLANTGRYNLVPMEPRKHIATFLAALNVYRWKKEKNL